MSRSRRAVLALTTSALLAVAACGGGGDPATSDQIAARSTPVGVAPDLVYVTAIDGFDLAPQSVGVSGDDGMSATYVNDGRGGTVTLRTSKTADPALSACSTLTGAAGAALACAVDRGQAHVVLQGQDVDPATLRQAADAVRVPTSDELDRLFAEVPTVRSPGTRGDLPPGGDGAPVDPTGPGG